MFRTENDSVWLGGGKQCPELSWDNRKKSIYAEGTVQFCLCRFPRSWNNVYWSIGTWSLDPTFSHLANQFLNIGDMQIQLFLNCRMIMMLWGCISIPAWSRLLLPWVPCHLFKEFNEFVLIPGYLSWSTLIAAEWLNLFKLNCKGIDRVGSQDNKYHREKARAKSYNKCLASQSLDILQQHNFGKQKPLKSN